MSNEYDRVQHEREGARQTKPAEFQEAPGETEAEAMSRAFVQNAGTQPAQIASALSSADGSMRAQALSRLQQERGNAYVQRVVSESKGAPGRMVGLSQPDMVDEVLQRKGSGQALPDTARAPMESQFDADLSDVRVHTDGEAKTLNRELDAQAFTVGKDIFFSEGKYNPTSSDGMGLLAHEMTHVGQQVGFGGAVQREAAAEEDEDTLQRQAVQRAPEEDEMPPRAAAENKKPDEEAAAAT
ncbi:MAG: DUF4157 domain-containing protein [Chloroflexi bacterium]|nr:DUF4157 domain-containing protein [Chloroflexota bacterium]